jgi:predicted aspartyl protease
VIDSTLASSLLGMSFLERLGSYAVEGDTMTMRR